MYQQLLILTVILFYELFKVGGFREKRQRYNISNPASVYAYTSADCLYYTKIYEIHSDSS